MPIETKEPLPEKQETMTVMTPDQILSEILDLNREIGRLDAAVESDKLRLKEDRKELTGLRMRLLNRLSELAAGQQKLVAITTKVAPLASVKIDGKKPALDNK